MLRNITFRELSWLFSRFASPPTGNAMLRMAVG